MKHHKKFYQKVTVKPSVLLIGLTMSFYGFISSCEIGPKKHTPTWGELPKDINKKEENNRLMEEVGLAGYYGDDFHGVKTYFGEKYNKDALTAAHKTLSYNTIVKVTNTKNNEHVIVRINDRGPYLKGRIIDLSGRAARHLKIYKESETIVKIAVLAEEK